MGARRHTAWQECRRLRDGADPGEVLDSIQKQLGGKQGEVVPDHDRGSLLATLVVTELW